MSLNVLDNCYTIHIILSYAHIIPSGRSSDNINNICTCMHGILARSIICTMYKRDVFIKGEYRVRCRACCSSALLLVEPVFYITQVR